MGCGRLVESRYKFRIVDFLTILTLFILTVVLFEGHIYKYSDYDDKFEVVQKLNLTDPRVLRYIEKNHVHHPKGGEYNLPEKIRPSDHKDALDKLLGNFTAGIFVEAGANDGVYLSNTLNLERYQNWSGVLIEANPKLFTKLIGTNRKSIVVDACLSPFKNLSNLEFLEAKEDAPNKWVRPDALGKLVIKGDRNNNPRRWFREGGNVRCFPLLSILQAVGIHHVDFFSLDVEGAELQILKTLPFDSTLNIDMFFVEYVNVPEGRVGVVNFMKSKGYSVVKKTSDSLFFTKTELMYRHFPHSIL